MDAAESKKPVSEGLNSRQRAEMEAARKRKKERRTYAIVGAVILVFALFVFFVNSSLFTNVLPALKVGGTNYSLAQIRYAYNTSYSNLVNQYGSILSGLLDTNKPLSEQGCAFDESLSWKEYFLNDGVAYLQEVTALSDAAKAEGLTLTDEEKQLIEDNITNMGLYASLYGYSTDGYIAANYGEGNNADTLREMLTTVQLASNYSAQKQKSFTYTDAELDARYEESAASYNTVSYSYVSLPADEEADSDAEAALAVARATADAIEAACDGTLETFQAAVLKETAAEASQTTVAWSSTGDNQAWFTDPARAPGDVLRSESDSGVYLYCYESIDTQEYNTVNVRHILIKAEDADADGSYSEEEKAKALTALEEIQAQWDGTEAGFIQLAEENSQDTGSNTNGGLYENVYKGAMVEEFNDFCFADHDSGDTAIVYGETTSYAGYHLVYYVGEGVSYHHLVADSLLRNADYSTWVTALLDGYPTTKTFMFRYA